jgi:DNA repair ATPase RecN
VEIDQELRKRLDIRTKSDEKALQDFLDYFSTHYTDIKRPKIWYRRKKERKHEHYWELAEKVKAALEEGYRKKTHIARYLGCSRGRVENLHKFLRKHGYSLEDLLTRYEEVIAFLKEHAKGGNKWHRKKEWNISAWIQEWQRKKEEYIQIRKKEAALRRERKRAQLAAKGIDPDRWRQAPVQLLPINLSSF